MPLNKQDKTIKKEQAWIDSIFPPKTFGEIPVGSVLLLKESMIKDGISDIPLWMNTAKITEGLDDEWFINQEFTLNKISIKKPKGSSFKRVIWELKASDGHTFEFSPGDSYEEVNNTYSVLGYNLDMVLKGDIDLFKQLVSGKSVFTSRQVGWTYTDKRGAVPQYYPIKLENCYVGRGNQPLRITAISEDGERIVVNANLTKYDIAPDMYELYSLANFILLDNPRGAYPNISDETWSMIQNRKIRLGMTLEECVLSWGEPTRKLRNSGLDNTITFVYGTTLVQFDNGVISVISE